MTKLGIFILPNKSIKNKILNLKKIVKKKFGSQKVFKSSTSLHNICF